MKILAINPGSTSTKITLFNNHKAIFTSSITHPIKKLESFAKIVDQYEYRKRLVLKKLTKAKINFANLDAIVGRGGLIKPVESGVYHVNDLMLHDLKIGYSGEHASSLGGILAQDLAKKTKHPENAFIVDPVVVDEMEDIARISGIPEIPRISIVHALNQKAVAKKYAKKIHKKYSELSLIIAHMGGGISIGAHKKGKIVDAGSGNLGEGTFTPERSGSVPLGSFLDLCFSKKYSYHELKTMIVGNGGLLAYLDTSDVRALDTKIEKGDAKTKLIVEAMAYQIAKEIGAYTTVLKGKVDAIILTGGIAHNKRICRWIKGRVKFIAKVVIYPGEHEMQALADGALAAINNKIPIKIYK
ncbi:MAG: butyrate kinase [Gammaproteobacteria bacterium]|nr:butyrate kinase [Gammaproteobacteria bacterium]